jgi:hypothetical protein
MSWKVFAEDSGTGLTDQADSDWADGAHLNALAHGQNNSNYSVVNPSLTPDYTVPDITLGVAQYRVTVTSVSERDHDGDSNTVDWPEATFVVYAPQTTLSLTDSDVNYIYLSLDLTTTGDDAQYVVNTTDTAPSGPSLKVGNVDCSNDTTSSFNTNPDGNFKSLTVNSGISSTGDISMGGIGPTLKGIYTINFNNSSYGFIKENGTVRIRLGGGEIRMNQTVNMNNFDINNASSIFGYEIQKNGTDGSGIINFKT